ncbi:tape measure protein [Curtobacterium phage Penoan]|nr:tape measure protein [Curtobacterium phage Penoan]
MASKTAVLSVRIITDAKQGKQGLQDYGSGLDGLQKSLDAFTPAAAVVTGGIGLMANAAGQAASDLQQSAGSVDAVFKQYASSVHDSATRAAEDVGLSADAYNGLAAIIGSQLKNAGTPLDDLAGKTQDIIGLGSDLAAVYGGDVQTAVDAISSLLRGESDPIEQYGVSINQAAVKAEELALGLDTSTAAAERSAQVQATLSLLTKQTTDAQGQYAAQSDTTAEAQQRANAEWQNALAALGTDLLPVMGMAADTLGVLSGFIQENTGFVEILVGVIGALAAAVLLAQGAIKAYEAGVAVVTAAQWLWNAAMTANPIGVIILAIAAVIAIIVLLATHWDQVTSAIQTGAAWIGNAFANLYNGAMSFLQPIIDWFRQIIDMASGIGNAVGWVRDLAFGRTFMLQASMAEAPMMRSAFATTAAVEPTRAAAVAPASQARAGASLGTVNNYNTTIQAGVADKYGTAKAVQSAVRGTDRATGVTRAAGRPRW